MKYTCLIKTLFLTSILTLITPVAVAIDIGPETKVVNLQKELNSLSGPDMIPVIEKKAENINKEFSKKFSGKTYGNISSSLRRGFFELMVIQKKKIPYLKNKNKTNDDKINLNLILVGPDYKSFYLVKRGDYKNIFSGKKTFSATFHEGHDSKDSATLLNLINNEFAIKSKPDRLVHTGIKARSQFHSYSFTPDNEEEFKLWEKSLKSISLPEEGKIFYEYNELKRELVIYTVDQETDEYLSDNWKAIFPFLKDKSAWKNQNTNTNSLAFYFLSNEDEKVVLNQIDKDKKKAKHLAKNKFSSYEELAFVFNRDTIEKISVSDFFEKYKENKMNYASDLIDPFLNNYHSSGTMRAFIDRYELLANKSSFIVGANSHIAGSSLFVGGKGENIHKLEIISPYVKGLNVPKSAVVITDAYKHYVMENDLIKREVSALDSLSKLYKDRADHELLEQIKKKGAEIRKLISGIEFNSVDKEQMRKYFHSLGKNVAVRSSATIEDSKGLAAAGLASSYLNVQDFDLMLQRVTDVWASNFEDGFILTRIKANIVHTDSLMAVVIMEMVNAKSAGVLFSTDVTSSSNRRAFRMSANLGLGESIVSGEGATDTWLVSPDGKYILEENISPKTGFSKTDETGEIKFFKFDKPKKIKSLETEDILRLTGIAKGILTEYRNRFDVEDIDVEFSFDEKKVFSIVQVRPVTTSGKGNRSLSLFKVDESSLEEGTPVKYFPEGKVGHPGAVCGPLQVLGPEEFDKVKPGVILVTNNTNNQWNTAFTMVKGLVTVRGNPDSHAGVNARENSLPALVSTWGEGVDAVDMIGKYQGEIACLDVQAKKIYITKKEIPLKKSDILLSLWADNASDIQKADSRIMDKISFLKQASSDKRKLLNSGNPNVMNDLDGVWLGKPRKSYSYYQLDYYNRAWILAYERLNKIAEKNNYSLVKPKGRKIVDRAIFEEVSSNNDESLYYFLDQFNYNDFLTLLTEYREHVDRLNKFIVDDANFDPQTSDFGEIDKVIVETLSWMHMAFWMQSTFEVKFVLPQTAYIMDKNYEDILFKKAFKNMFGQESTKLVKKWIDVAYVESNVEKNPELLKIFKTEDNLYAYFEENNSKFKSFMNDIHLLSKNYKEGSEDIRVLDDSEIYLKNIKSTILDRQRSLVIPWLSDYLSVAILNETSNSNLLKSLKGKDPKVYSILEGLAKRGNMELIEVLQLYRNNVKNTENIWDTASADLKHYSDLNKILAVYKGFAILREDGHQYVTPLQRRAAKFLLTLAKNNTDVFKGEPSDIFDLNAVEILNISDKKGGNLAHIPMTFERVKIRDQAESEFRNLFNRGKVKEAVTQYENSVAKIREIINKQINLADDSVKSYYMKIDLEFSNKLKNYKEHANKPQGKPIPEPVLAPR